MDRAGFEPAASAVLCISCLRGRHSFL